MHKSNETTSPKNQMGSISKVVLRFVISSREQNKSVANSHQVKRTSGRHLSKTGLV